MYRGYFILFNYLPLIVLSSEPSVEKKHKIRGRDYGSSYEPPLPPSNDFPSGYNYPIPIPSPPLFDIPDGIYEPPHRPNISFPPFQDEPPASYLPPPVYPPLGTPPQSDPIPADDPLPPNQPPNDQYLPPSTLYGTPAINANSNPVQFRVFNMSCLDATSGRFFRSVIRTSQLVETAPVIDNVAARSDCIFGSGDTFRIDLQGSRMVECGVRYCSGSERISLCVPLRVPAVRGIRLPEDSSVTLQCRPQERIASQTRQLRMNPQVIQGRSTAAIASGGLQRNFDTQVTLLRRTSGNNDFTQVVGPGSVVQLGEELLLRAAVREGDGWRYSRMGAVLMQRVAGPSRRTAQDSVILVDNLGCRIPTMRSVCPEHPRQVNPLVTTFPFRAFMFQGADSGDEMILSVRMLGCLQQEDCTQARFCDGNQPNTRSRVKRETASLQTAESKNLTNYWQSYLEFRVVLPELNHETNLTNKNSSVVAAPVFLLLGFASLVLLILLGVIVARRK